MILPMVALESVILKLVLVSILTEGLLLLSILFVNTILFSNRKGDNYLFLFMINNMQGVNPPFNRSIA